MCAIFGWLDYKGMIPHRILQKLTQALANASEERGTDAAGISYVENGKIKIFKRPKPAHKIKFNVPNGTKAVMGHTRLTTQGNEKFNFNNHPFYGKADKSFAFAHNGVLYNERTIRKEKQLPATHIETDSYIAVQLIEKQGKLDFDSLKSMAEDISGSFMFTALDEENKLYFIKGSNPIHLLHFEDIGLYVYASTESIVTKALHRTGLHKFSHNQIELFDGDMLSIDRYGTMEQAEFDCLGYGYNTSFYPDYFTYEDESEIDLLLDMCHCFGYDEEDVHEMLAYGYTCEEIEEFFMSPSITPNEVCYG